MLSEMADWLDPLSVVHAMMSVCQKHTMMTTVNRLRLTGYVRDVIQRRSNMGAAEKKNTEIVQWYICLIDNNDCEERLCADIPDDLSKRIDNMIEQEYDVDWEQLDK